MITIADLDPVFHARITSEQPRLWPNHLRMVRAAHEVHADQLATLDAELETLAARRRAILDRLDRLRPRLWPESHRRHVRRPPRVDEAPIPPSVVGAETLHGVELRRVLVGIVRRHGEVSLRELHGLIHRYGYQLDSPRPVQRLADAAAYETRAGRLRRVNRGVYGPGAVSAEEIDLADPLPWSAPEPDDEPPSVDPAVADDPDRWTDQAWPSAAQVGADYLPPPVDPAERSLGEDLTASVAATRQRLAALITERHALRPPLDPPNDALGPDSSTNRSPGREPREWGSGSEVDREP